MINWTVWNRDNKAESIQRNKSIFALGKDVLFCFQILSLCGKRVRRAFLRRPTFLSLKFGVLMLFAKRVIYYIAEREDHRYGIKHSLHGKNRCENVHNAYCVKNIKIAQLWKTIFKIYQSNSSMCTIFTDRNVTINASWDTDVYFWFNPLWALPTAKLSIPPM